MTGAAAPDIAIIGLAGRFPGAGDASQFWQNLQAGVESIGSLTDDDLAAAGVAPALRDDPHYVRAAPLLAGAEQFDAAFFGYTPREAATLDPQQRVFLECAHETLEAAGYDPGQYDGTIGVYAGASLNTYLLFGDLLPQLRRDYLFTVLANDKDFLTSRVSYQLDLTGPSVTVQTACSTALVAVHTACQSLLARECDMALAGGVCVRVPQTAGYLWQPGGILSPDGHCRAFDAAAQGTVFGSGAGVVLLKRLSDALADGDRIRAVVKGSAVTNDGAGKAGFAAPSVAGQAGAAIEAIARSGVDPETISYVEAHGTGTRLGDPIEIAALSTAFRAFTARRSFCAIGSVKTNIGHADAAAGVLSLIKTVLALEHGQLPASLHFERPNPELRLDESPFFVNERLTEWPRGATPRRAAVNSLGMGGTNAFLVLEEAPPRAPSGPARPQQLLELSAGTETALAAVATRLADRLSDDPGLDLADVAYTLQVGRQDRAYARFVVCPDTAAAVRLLREPGPATRRPPARPGAVFLFPGQGSQYPGMALGLARSEPVFREHLEHCAELLHPLLGRDLREVLADDDLRHTEWAQPALFAVEYALARLWISWGVRPTACLGHSLGEYVAASLCGVLSLADALTLVTARGRLMRRLPAGAMLALPLSEAEVRSRLVPGVSVAAVNGPADVVVAGPPDAIDALAARVPARGVRLPVTQAFHSTAVEAVLDELVSAAGKVELRAPSIPYVSGVTGTWITDQEATDPAYYGRHLRSPVRFGDGVRAVLDDTGEALLEVGPGRTLGNLARRGFRRPGERAVVASLPGGGASLLTAVGRLRLAGVEIDRRGFYAGQRRLRVPLPTYPFERARHWIDQAGDRAPAPTAPPAPRPASPPRPAVVDPGARPWTPLEGAVAAVWRALLGVDRLAVTDDFFELGGSSVLIPEVLTRLNEIFQVDLAALTLLESPTVAGLAERIEDVYRLSARPTLTEEAQSCRDRRP